MGKLAVFAAAGPWSTLESFLTSEELQAVQLFWFLENLRKSLRRRNIVAGRLGKKERETSHSFLGLHWHDRLVRAWKLIPFQSSQRSAKGGLSFFFFF